MTSPGTNKTFAPPPSPWSHHYGSLLQALPEVISGRYVFRANNLTGRFHNIQCLTIYFAMSNYSKLDIITEYHVISIVAALQMQDTWVRFWWLSNVEVISRLYDFHWTASNFVGPSSNRTLPGLGFTPK
jgi:hypothetical protein